MAGPGGSVRESEGADRLRKRIAAGGAKTAGLRIEVFHEKRQTALHRWPELGMIVAGNLSVFQIRPDGERGRNDGIARP